MKRLLILSLIIPFNLFSQPQDSTAIKIDAEVKRIHTNWNSDKLKPDTLTYVNEEYDQQYIVGWYEGKNLQILRIDNGDGSAGDISSGKEYYFKDGELIFILDGISYFMAGGCGVTEKIYFNKGDFVQVISSTDCKGENAKVVHDYLGGYVFSLDGTLGEYKKYMDGVKLVK